jgi:hypothetical protein
VCVQTTRLSSFLLHKTVQLNHLLPPHTEYAHKLFAWVQQCVCEREKDTRRESVDTHVLYSMRERALSLSDDLCVRKKDRVLIHTCSTLCVRERSHSLLTSYTCVCRSGRTKVRAECAREVARERAGPQVTYCIRERAHTHVCISSGFRNCVPS